MSSETEDRRDHVRGRTALFTRAQRSPVSVVMFDLDGTLIDTMQGYADVAATIMAELHGQDPNVGRRQYLATSGIPFRQQLELIHPGHAANHRASDLFEHRKRAYADAADLDGATLDALRRLRASGLSLVVSSNSAQRLVDEFAARQHLRFELLLGFDVAANLAKGAPHVRRTCEALGVSAGEIVFCGDSIKDGELAHECGIRFVARLGTFSRAEFRRWHADVLAVDDIQELCALLASEPKG